MTRTPRESPLTSGDVARLFNVTPVTVAKWCDQGALPYFRTPGGQRRFKRQDVEALLGHPIEVAS